MGKPKSDGARRSAVAPGHGVTRRRLLDGAGALGTAASVPAGRVRAADAAETLKVGFVSPRSGALAGFGWTSKITAYMGRLRC